MSTVPAGLLGKASTSSSCSGSARGRCPAPRRMSVIDESVSAASGLVTTTATTRSPTFTGVGEALSRGKVHEIEGRPGSGVCAAVLGEKSTVAGATVSPSRCMHPICSTIYNKPMPPMCGNGNTSEYRSPAATSREPVERPVRMERGDGHVGSSQSTRSSRFGCRPVRQGHKGEAASRMRFQSVASSRISRRHSITAASRVCAVSPAAHAW